MIRKCPPEDPTLEMRRNRGFTKVSCSYILPATCLVMRWPKWIRSSTHSFWPLVSFVSSCQGCNGEAPRDLPSDAPVTHLKNCTSWKRNQQGNFQSAMLIFWIEDKLLGQSQKTRQNSMSRD